ncbi:hypothetical protein LGH82_14025 [Mesorhizobium sp. PAMC28654]|uniref:hypothetical protein n=1 Tax=Mesorhizobium sp. PAMC28654 TaxID=2880934 RepID=UPI001D0A73B5|nr:hypothetical protein [Mesorhizobium sp. PAMC28654]UDL92240.1 hypothetical protein LGH82_14025 [Mesorhizobium sp. PAMC28654]
MTVFTMNNYRSIRQDNRPLSPGKREAWTRTLDNVAWAVSGKGPQELANQGKRGEFDIWNQLGFYNYIPVVLANAPQTKRPDRELFSAGKVPFEQVIEKHKPQILIVCGFQLFPWLIRNHYPEYKDDPWTFEGDWIDIPREGPIRAVRMKHPAIGFSHKKWHQVIRRATSSELG